MSWPYLIGGVVMGVAVSLVLGRIIRNKPEFVSEAWLKENTYNKT